MIDVGGLTMAKDKKEKDDGWRLIEPDCGFRAREGQLVLVEGSQYKKYGSYWELLDDVIHRTFDISVNSPEEYEVLDMDERKKLDAVHAAWFP